MEKSQPEISQNLSKILKKLPHSPGVYIYRNKENEILYIGKAIDLFRRVHQYFQKKLSLPPKTRILVGQINQIEIIKTLSEFDALLLEAKLIYQNQPKYNILAKDDKSPLYIKISQSEKLPRILFVRKPRNPTYGMTKLKGDLYFGPFQSGKTARMVLSSVRRIIPFCLQNKRNGKPCFYTQIGLCDPCPSYIEGINDEIMKQKLILKYRNNINRIRDMLSGKSQQILRILEKEMHEFAELQNFELAAVRRNQIEALHNLIKRRFDPMFYVSSDNQVESITGQEITELTQILKKYYPAITSLKRIECIDISNFSGTDATGSLVVMIDGIPDRNLYRRFKIKITGKPNDFAMISEVISRRLNHPEWPFPDLFVIDGGKGQISSAIDSLKVHKIDIPVIGLAKRDEEIVIHYNNSFRILRLPLQSSSLHALERIRDEAHRFAVSYHRKLRKLSQNVNITTR
jgi:excinuclease ABC subunit C